MNFQSAGYGTGFGRNVVSVGNTAWVFSAGGYGLLRLSAP
jgi:hypothetical protein